MGERYRAVWRWARISWRKVKPVMDLVRGRNVEEARAILRATHKRAADMVLKVLDSAVANAVYQNQRHNRFIKPDKLYISECYVCKGPFLKRWRPVARGRVHPYKRHMSHLFITVAEEEK